MTVQDDLQEDLAIAITKERGGQGAGELAEGILRRDHQLFLLIGITNGAKSAVYYDSGTWDGLDVPIEGSKLGGIRKSRIATKQHWGKVEEWVHEISRDRWAWLHPRFQWVFGLGFRQASDLTT